MPVKNSLCYAAALADNNVPFSVHIYPYGEHGLSTCDALTNNPEIINKQKALTKDWLCDLKKWIDIL